jgi:hypothetical protein
MALVQALQGVALGLWIEKINLEGGLIYAELMGIGSAFLIYLLEEVLSLTNEKTTAPIFIFWNNDYDFCNG